MNKSKSSILIAILAGTGLVSGCSLMDVLGTDTEISMNELPAAVRPQAEKEVAGLRIKEVEKEIKRDGQVIYAITYFDQAGDLMEIEYAEDGMLVSKGYE